jgi:hypothetical protein
MDRMRFSLPRRRRRRSPFVDALGQRGAINALAGVFGLVLLLYLLSGWTVLLLLLLGLAGVGVDQLLRAHPRAEFQGPTATAIYLFVPVLYALGAALFLRDVAGGPWSLPAAVIAAAIFALAAQAEYLTVDAAPETYPTARFALSLVSYLTAFALFAVVFTAELVLPAAVAIVSVVALLLTVDILRELEVQTGTLFAYAAAVAAVTAEVRWATYYLGLGDLVAAALLLITFYELTGLVQSYLSGHLDRRTVLEYALVFVVGLMFVGGGEIIARRA